MAKKVMESNVISRWGILALEQANKETRYFQLVMEKLKEQGWPHPAKEVDVGDGWFGRKQRYIEIKAGKLVAYIGAQSIGKHAYLGWSLTLAEPGLFKKAAASVGGFDAYLFQNMTFNEANSARAFAAALNYCVQGAVDVLLSESGVSMDYSREASGPLGRLI